MQAPDSLVSFWFYGRGPVHSSQHLPLPSLHQIQFLPTRRALLRDAHLVLHGLLDLFLACLRSIRRYRRRYPRHRRRRTRRGAALIGIVVVVRVDAAAIAVVGAISQPQPAHALVSALVQQALVPAQRLPRRHGQVNLGEQLVARLRTEARYVILQPNHDGVVPAQLQVPLQLIGARLGHAEMPAEVNRRRQAPDENVVGVFEFAVRAAAIVALRAAAVCGRKRQPSSRGCAANACIRAVAAAAATEIIGRRRRR